MNTSTKIALTTALLLSSLGTHASAQTTAQPTVASASANDVPANHWAREAVSILLARGIITGYPDNTFRGNSTLTRYEAATIFSRLLQSGALNQASTQSLLKPGDLEAIIKGMTEIQTQMGTTDARVKDMAAEIDALKVRLSTSETALNQVTQNAATQNELAQVAAGAQAKLDEALKQAQDANTAALNAALDLKADQTTVSALEARLAALEKSLTDLQGQVASAKAPTVTTTTTPAPGAGPNLGDGSTPFTPDKPASSATSSGLYAGGGVTLNLSSQTGFTAMVGTDKLFQGLGLRGSGTYSPKGRNYSGQFNVTRNFGGGDSQFRPYAGLGAGFITSPSLNNAETGATDMFASGLAGVNYDFTDTMTLYGELDARYYLSGKGTGAGTGTGRGGFGFTVGAGIKINF